MALCCLEGLRRFGSPKLLPLSPGSSSSPTVPVPALEESFLLGRAFSSVLRFWLNCAKSLVFWSRAVANLLVWFWLSPALPLLRFKNPRSRSLLRFTRGPRYPRPLA